MAAVVPPGKEATSGAEQCGGILAFGMPLKALGGLGPALFSSDTQLLALRMGIAPPRQTTS